MKIVIFLIEGWSENPAQKNMALLKERLQKIPDVEVVIVEYLNGKGFLGRFCCRHDIWWYSNVVEKSVVEKMETDQNAFFMAMGYSLGGVIVRHLYRFKGLFQEEALILVGTPNLGFDWGFTKNLFCRILGGVFDVPMVEQLMRGSTFLSQLNQGGIPAKAHYIIGRYDNVVARWSSDPHGKATIINTDHKLFPLEKDKPSAVEEVASIVEHRRSLITKK